MEHAAASAGVAAPTSASAEATQARTPTIHAPDVRPGAHVDIALLIAAESRPSLHALRQSPRTEYRFEYTPQTPVAQESFALRIVFFPADRSQARASGRARACSAEVAEGRLRSQPPGSRPGYSARGQAVGQATTKANVRWGRKNTRGPILLLLPAPAQQRRWALLGLFAFSLVCLRPSYGPRVTSGMGVEAL